MKVFNNLTRELEPFSPANGKTIAMYSCGPTVYDISHIGHARSCIVWDMVYRFLKFQYGKDRNKEEQSQEIPTCWIRNITNVDDKIVNRAAELNIAPSELSEKYTREFWADMKSLNKIAFDNFILTNKNHEQNQTIPQQICEAKRTRY